MNKVFMLNSLSRVVMSSNKKSAPLPASSGGLMRFFEDETKGFKIDPKIVISIPISLIAVSWAIDIFLAP